MFAFMSLNTETIILWLAQLVFCYCAVLVMLRFFGIKGIAVLMGTMVIAANLQVLKLFQMPLYHHVLPLGTALMATNYLASDMLAEYFNQKAAKTCINLAIAAFVILTIAMFFTIAFPVITKAEQLTDGVSDQNAVQNAVQILFSPAPKLFISSIISFFISQRIEITIFCWIRKHFGEKNLWFRNNISTWIAAMCDNIVFSILVWRLFTHTPVHWHELIFGYIFGTYFVRVFMALLDTPMIYLAKFCLPKKETV